MMDTKRFELTDAEIGRIIGSLPDAANEVYPCLGGGYFHTCCHYQEVLKAQVAKVLSRFEPVELEAPSGNELAGEIWHKVEGVSSISHLEAAAQYTIRHNQKGQLYRIREAD